MTLAGTHTVVQTILAREILLMVCLQNSWIETQSFLDSRSQLIVRWLVGKHILRGPSFLQFVNMIHDSRILCSILILTLIESLS